MSKTKIDFRGSEQQANIFGQYVETNIHGTLSEMSERLRRSDKAIVVIDALKDAIRCKKLQPLMICSDNCRMQGECYQDADMLYIRSKKLMTIVCEYCKDSYIPMDIVNKEELFGLLERLQILDVYEKDGKREKSRKLPEPKGNSLRYMYIKKSVLFSINEE